ncbi:MFS transporter [Kribbella soli]
MSTHPDRVRVSPDETTGAVGGWLPVVAIALAVFMLLLQATVVSVALPAIQKDLAAGRTALQWVIDGYALTLAALQLVGGSAGDRFGHRNVFITGVAVFASASLVSGFAPSVTVLIGAVAVQGVGGALMFSTTLALIAHYYRGSSRGTAFAIRGTVAGVAAAAGPLLGGVVTTWLGWRWIFWLNVPVAAATVAIAVVSLRHEGDRERGRRLDIGGALSFSATLLLLVFALLRGNDAGWTSKPVLGLFAGAIVGLIAFLVIEHRTSDPMLDLTLFRRREFTGAQVAALAAQGSLFPLYIFLSLYFQGSLGYTPLQTGVRFLVITVPILLVGATVGALMDKVPVHRLVATGLLLMAAGLLLMHRLNPTSTWTALIPGFLVAGIGVGFALPPLGALAISVADPTHAGMASGINNTFQQVGFTLGLATYGALYAHQPTPTTALNHLFTTAASVALLGALLTLTLNRTGQAKAGDGSADS